MRTTAEFGGSPHRHDAHGLTVLFPEEHHGPRGLRFFQGHHAGDDFGVGKDFLIDDRFDFSNFFCSEGLVVQEVKTRHLVRDEAALLSNVRPQHFSERLVHQVRHRMVACDGRTRFRVHFRLEDVAHAHHSFLHVRHVTENAFLDAVGFGNRKQRRRIFENAGVTHLAAHFRVEGGLIQNDDHVVARSPFFNLHAALIEREHLGFGFHERFVPREHVVFTGVENVRGDLEFARGTRLRLLFGHRAVKALGVDPETFFAAHVPRQIHREAVRVVQLEGHITA